jgi:hypothetical protein
MFQFSFRNQNYLVKFFHSNKEDIAKLAADKTIPFKVITTCVIYNILATSHEVVDGKTVTKNVLEEASSGSSFCSKKDNFSRSFGRGQSLDRALDGMGFSKWSFTYADLVAKAYLAYEDKLITEREKTLSASASG